MADEESQSIGKEGGPALQDFIVGDEESKQRVAEVLERASEAAAVPGAQEALANLKAMFDECGWSWNQRAMEELIAIHGLEAISELKAVADHFRDRMSWTGDIWEYLQGKAYPMDNKPQTIMCNGERGVLIDLHIDRTDRSPNGSFKLTMEYLVVKPVDSLPKNPKLDDEVVAGMMDPAPPLTVEKVRELLEGSAEGEAELGRRLKGIQTRGRLG